MAYWSYWDIANNLHECSSTTINRLREYIISTFLLSNETRMSHAICNNQWHVTVYLSDGIRCINVRLWRNEAMELVSD